jgi:hypothetical protein
MAQHDIGDETITVFQKGYYRLGPAPALAVDLGKEAVDRAEDECADVVVKRGDDFRGTIQRTVPDEAG